VDLGFATELQLLDLCGQPELDLRASSVAAAFARGDLCVAAYDRQRTAGYCWLAFAPLRHLDDVWVRFGPHVVWTYKSLVLPQYRGRGIATLLYRFADRACRERHRTLSVVCVERHNPASIRAAQKAGYADAGTGGYVRRGRVFFDWYSSPLRKDGVSFFIPDARAK
jgi:GNAT superfamily N-acetyltransferase